MFSKTLLALALTAGLALPLAAAADDLSYSYVEGGYTDLDGDANGPFVRGSYAFGEQFYAFGSYAALDSDFGGFDIDVGDLGVGYRHPFAAHTDGIAELAYSRVDTDFGDADGYRASLGARHAFGENWEGLAKVNYTDGRDFNGDVSATLGGQFKFNPSWALVAETDFGDGDSKAYRLGLRASF